MPGNLTLRTVTAPGPFSPAWLLCEVSGFSPVDILLTWLEGQQEVEPSQFATAHTTAQAGRASSHTWSVVRVSSPLDHVGATYTCVVSHEASRTLLNGSCRLDTGGESHGPGAPSERPGHGEGSEGQPQRRRAAGTRPLHVGVLGLWKPHSCPAGPGHTSTRCTPVQEGREVLPAPQDQAAISHQDVPATGHKAGACPGLGVRAATINSCPLGASEAPRSQAAHPSGSPVGTWEATYAQDGGWSWAPRGV